MKNPFLDDPPAPTRSVGWVICLFLLSLVTRGWRETLADLGAFWEIS
jgi:hypothetical protein